jgi:hypothetical protein
VSEQPEALRLADALDRGTYLLSRERNSTAAELRRLHEVSAELLEALKAYEAWADPTICRDAELRAIRIQIRAAIAKAEGKT